MTVINDILDFSKIEAGKMTIEVVDFDLARLMEEVAELLTPSAHQKGWRSPAASTLRCPIGSGATRRGFARC